MTGAALLLKAWAPGWRFELWYMPREPRPFLVLAHRRRFLGIIGWKLIATQRFVYERAARSRILDWRDWAREAARHG